jgi:hypothetical protein
MYGMDSGAQATAHNKSRKLGGPTSRVETVNVNQRMSQPGMEEVVAKGNAKGGHHVATTYPVETKPAVKPYSDITDSPSHGYL